MENEELIFVLNTAELSDAGFEGSFNELADTIENELGGSVSGEYDEEGVPVMSVYGVSRDEIEDVLSDYGVDDPSEFTQEVEDGESFDFDEEENDEEDVRTPMEDDEIEIVDDEEDEIEDDEEDEIDELVEESYRFRRNHNRPLRESRQHKTEKPKGTQNLSEAVTLKILEEVKDKAIMSRILESLANDISNQEFIAECKESANRGFRKMYEFAEISVNGKKLYEMSTEEIKSMLKESKSNYRKYFKKFKTLNEAQDQESIKYAKTLRKQHKLIKLLESAVKFRTQMLNEDDEFPTEPSADIPNGDNNQPTEQTNNQNEEGDVTADLTAITFKVKNADDFIKIMTDNGIPEEAFEKGGDSSLENEEEPQDEQPTDDGMGGGAPQGGDMGGGAPGANPFESLTSRLSKKNRLNEDENPFMDGGETEPSIGNPDQPAEDSGTDPLSTESNNNSEDGEEVRLIDTSYAAKVRQILADKFHYDTEKFDDALGGTIVDDGSDETMDGSDGLVDDGTQEQTNDTNPDAEAKEGTEEEINPEDVFGDL